MIEEVHADLRSSLEIFCQTTAHAEQPLDADIFVLTRKKPKHVSDLSCNDTSYILGFVARSSGYCETLGPDQHVVMLSRKLEIKSYRESYYIVFLLNMTPSIRIWKSLDLEMAKERNMCIINKILSYDSSDKNRSSTYSLTKTFLDECVSDNLMRFNLNDSQKNAVLDCLSMRQDNEMGPIKLIWGPPGTGKTKLISILLLALLQLECRTLTSSPTNTAVVEVASRIHKLVIDEQNSSKVKFSTGDIILFGNRARMKIDEGHSQFFLEDRGKRLLEKCFMPICGWKHCVSSMTEFLENALSQYNEHVIMKLQEQKEKERAKAKIKSETFNEDENECAPIETFSEFVLLQYCRLAKNLEECIQVLCKDLPRSCIPDVTFTHMNIATALIKKFRDLLTSACASDNEDLEEIFESTSEKSEEIPLTIYLSSCLPEYLSMESRLKKGRSFLLQLCRQISTNFNLPSYTDSISVQDYCLQNATLIFCTACSSFRLHNVKMEKPLKFLIVDEAAQLKECESLIPLQIEGIYNAVLIGDECQLPAMVKSQISENAGFGRSLFERLSSLGYEKNLLDVQYRMHPSISKFPNSNFYENMISDGENVLAPSYLRRYLLGPLYGPYSFINIRRGKEETDKNGRNPKNMIEAVVVLKVDAAALANRDV